MELLSRATLVTARKIAWFSGAIQNPPRGAMYSQPIGQDNFHRIHNSGVTRETVDLPYKVKSNDIFLRHLSASAANRGIRIVFEPESSISFWQITAVKTVLDQLDPSFCPSAHFNCVNLYRAARYLGPLSAANGEMGFDSNYYRSWGHKEFLSGLIHELSHFIKGFIREKVKAIPEYSLDTSLGAQINDLAYNSLGEGPTLEGCRMHHFYLADFTALYLLRGESLRELIQHPDVAELHQLLKQNIFGGKQYLNAD